MSKAEIIRNIVVRLVPEQAGSLKMLRIKLANKTGVSEKQISAVEVVKRSIDARGADVMIQIQANLYLNMEVPTAKTAEIAFRNVGSAAKKVIIVGAGPAGLFAALKLIEAGLKPVILERGKDVQQRRRDLAAMNKQGTVNPESNYCFGEGGAGTYSDGKLYTRSNKRGNISRILNLFVHFGAPYNILIDAHPHIGTNKLPAIIVNMRNAILEYGGEVHFNSKVADITIQDDCVKNVVLEDGSRVEGDAFIFATGHSARDIFHLFKKRNILLEPKPFALGARVEHPQGLIDKIQYGRASYGLTTAENEIYLPPASYSLVSQENGKGVFSFCMCPGGIIAAAATAPGEIVVNGWSPSRRNNPFANSGIVAEVIAKDAFDTVKHLGIPENDPLLFLHYQQYVEQNCFSAGGGNLVAPAQCLADFTKNMQSNQLPKTSYQPGVTSVNLSKVLPAPIADALRNGFKTFGKKLKGYLSNEAVLVATESRTSSPVRIPRLPGQLNHPQVKNLYPCGEGAGYAGGIVSAAMDGENVAAQIAAQILS